MSTTIELKYFNTFWLKKMRSVVENTPTQPVAPYKNVPLAYGSSTARDWYIEESRIRGGYNNTTVDFGVKAYIAEEHPGQQNRINTMIYSGIFNSRTGVNNTNQFSVAESITRSVDPANGSIHDFFRDQLSSLNNVPVDANGNVIAKVRGGFDFHTKNYVLSIQNQDNSYITSSFDEDVKGWTSFFTYKPSFVASLNSNFYSFYTGKLYKHHSGNYGNFYGQISDSNVTVILNSQPSTVKVFQTINYEGKTGWEMQSMEASSGDASLAIGAFVQPTSLSGLETQVFSLQFKKKENKFFANLQQQLSETLTPEAGEVLWGSDVSGIKGFWSTIVMTLNNTTYSTTKKELFAVSSDTVESSY